MGQKIIGFATVVIGALGLTPVGEKFIQAYIWDWIVRMLNEYLSSLELSAIKPYVIPAVFIAIGFYLLLWPRARKLTGIFDKAYKNEVVKVDGKAFHNCTFENVTFEYRGGPYSIHNANVVGNRRFETPKSEIAGGITLLKILSLLGDAKFVAEWTTLPPEHFNR